MDDFWLYLLAGVGSAASMVFGFFIKSLFPFLVDRSKKRDQQASDLLAADLKTSSEKLAARLKSESAAFDQSLSQNEKFVNDILNDKNVRFKDIKDALGQIALHNHQQGEWSHQFGESVEDLTDNEKKAIGILLQTQNMIASELATRRLLVSLIEQMYRRLFSESPDTTIIDE